MKQTLLTLITILLLTGNAMAGEKETEKHYKSKIATDNRYAATKWHPKHYFAVGAGIFRR